MTTTALALAATWPEHRRCLLVEADPFGGVIAARYGLGDSPGLSSLAAVARRGLDDDLVWQHAQQLPGGVRVLVGPASADEAHAVLRDIGGAFAAWSAAQTEVDFIVDCGRIAPGSVALGPLLAAGVVMVVTRPTLDQLRPAAHRLASLEDSGIEASLLLVGDQPYGSDEVSGALGSDVAGVVAWDPRTAAVLTGTHGAVRDLRRSLLVRSVATLAEGMATPLADLDPRVGMSPAPGIPASKVAQEAGS
ncbi:MAG: hypothetical protein WD651_04400 [Acidimicrobiia bacterium]